MASVVRQGNGRFLIQLSPGEHPDRPKVRLGKTTKRGADAACGHIEHLIRCRTSGGAPPQATAEWLANMPERLRARLERYGLVGPRARRDVPTLGAWLGTYFASRGDVKDSTATAWGHTKRCLLTYFGADKPLDAITPGDVDDFRIHLATREGHKGDGLADNTVRRRLGIAKQFFRAAVRREIIAGNPFDGQSTQLRENAKRYHFVSRADTEAIIDACPDAEWRLVVALCRYGGLRCPSEVLRLRWGDVDWGSMRFTVHASKTEHHDGSGIRHVPIFPELHPHLRDAFEQAEDGAERVIGRYPEDTPNLRTELRRIIKRAGLTPWAKLFQNMRSSRETELAGEFPVHVAAKWIGNSVQVAAKHYLQVTDEHFDRAVQKAVQNPVQHPAATHAQGGATEQRPNGEGASCGEMRGGAVHCKSSSDKGMGATGLEPVTSSL